MSKNKKNKLKIGIPPDWEEKLAKIAQDNCTSKTAIIYQAIANYLEGDYSDFPLNSRLEKIESELHNLRETVALIESQNREITLLNKRLTVLEKTPAANPLELVVKESFAEPFDEEDWQDEPDEILIDFLP